jgi:2-oxoglutarate ferredoxin oxidoreductase subunit alpha
MMQHVPAPEVEYNAKAAIGLVCYGTTRWALEESRDQLVREYGIETSYFRLKAYPFTEALNEFIDRHECVYVVEQNRDAQLLGLMRLELTPARINKLRSIRYYGGMPLDARTVTTEFVSQEGL